MSSTIVIVKERAVRAVKVGGITGPPGPPGSGGLTTVSITADHVAVKDTLILADASSGSITITSVAPAEGDSIVVVKTDSTNNTVTLPDGTVIQYQNSAANLVFDGSAWRII